MPKKSIRIIIYRIPVFLCFSAVGTTVIAGPKAVFVKIAKFLTVMASTCRTSKGHRHPFSFIINIFE